MLAGAPVIITDDVEAAADLIRPTIALYIGGMGAKDVNFHARVYERMGYEAEVAKIQDLYLAGHKDEAIAAVPTRLIEETALIGPKAKLRDDLMPPGRTRSSRACCCPPDIADHARHGRTAQLIQGERMAQFIDYTGKNVLVTGGSSGVGASLVDAAREPRRDRHGAGPQRAARLHRGRRSRIHQG